MWKDSETEIDYLNFRHLTDLLTELIDNDKLLPSTIGVYGDWGSGKSSLIKMSIKNLNERNSDEKIVSLNFNGWMFEGYEDAKLVLLESILDTIKDNISLTDKGKQLIKGLYRSIDKMKLIKKGVIYSVDLFTTGGIGTVIDLVVDKFNEQTSQNLTDSQIEKTIGSIRDGMNYSELREDIKLFQKKFAELLEISQIDKLVIFIDELDRCSPDTIIETLEAIRLFVFTGSTTFIIGADERHISYSVERKFAEIQGKQIDIGKEYLEKLVQYPIKIPQLDANEVEFYIFCLLLEDTFTEDLSSSIFYKINENRLENRLDFKLFEAVKEFSEYDYYDKLSVIYNVVRQLAGLLAISLNGNPRQCKRFLNTMKMREIMSKSYGIELNRFILTKIMLLEYFKPAAYEQVSLISNRSFNGSVNELSQLENHEVDEANPLFNFFQDDWGKKWLAITPSLNNTNLKKYLFFTRDSLKNQNNLATLQLSNIGKKVLDMLSMKGSASLKQAISLSDQLQRFERIEIAKILTDRIQLTTEKYDFSQFKNLFEWVINNKDVLDETIFLLSNLEGNKLTLGSVPLFQGCLSDKNNDKRLVQLINKWSNQNANIDKAMNKKE